GGVGGWGGGGAGGPPVSTGVARRRARTGASFSRARTGGLPGRRGQPLLAVEVPRRGLPGRAPKGGAPAVEPPRILELLHARNGSEASSRASLRRAGVWPSRRR